MYFIILVCTWRPYVKFTWVENIHWSTQRVSMVTNSVYATKCLCHHSSSESSHLSGLDLVLSDLGRWPGALLLALTLLMGGRSLTLQQAGTLKSVQGGALEPVQRASAPCLAAACAYLPYMVPAVYVASTGRAEWRAGYRRPRKWYAAPHRRQITAPSTHSLYTARAAAQQGHGLQAARPSTGRELTGYGHSCCWWGQSELQRQGSDLQHASRCEWRGNMAVQRAKRGKGRRRQPSPASVLAEEAACSVADTASLSSKLVCWPQGSFLLVAAVAACLPEVAKSELSLPAV